MKKHIILVSSLTILCCFASWSYAFRCGDGNRYLATEGMHKYQILKDCGEPYSREDVGYDKNHGSYRVIEEWIYIIEDTGNKQMYLIKFDRNGIADSVEWLGEQP
ncbi:MAG: DUF2845 domain-containing protein [Desulfuromonadales bacterium]|nr:DUF2845 domain-containing protein [Desulfuromonadales bacterium]